jgi:hypothetical protein
MIRYTPTVVPYYVFYPIARGHGQIGHGLELRESERGLDWLVDESLVLVGRKGEMSEQVVLIEISID